MIPFQQEMLPRIFRTVGIQLTQDGHTGSFSTNSLPGRSPEETQKLVKGLIEGTTFTAWFVPTYHAVLLFALVSVTLWRWSHGLVRELRFHIWRRSPERSTIGTASWGKHLVRSTHDAFAQGLRKPDERSSLLNGTDEVDKRQLTARLSLRLRALSMYQPAPVPFVNKIIPSNGSSLCISILLGLNVFYLLFRIHFEFDLTAVLGDRAGLLFVSNLPWLYLLGAKNQPLQWLTGLSYEHLNIYHRRLGEFLTLLAVVHFASMLCAWYSLFLPRGMELLDFLTRRVIALGIGAFSSYVLLFATSLASFRQWWYELFLASHVVLQAGGLVLLFFHHRGSRLYTLISLAIFLIDRVVFRLGLKSRSIPADIKLLSDGETILLSADWPITPSKGLWSLLVGRDIRHGWKCAEHVFITIPAIAHKHILQAHPFTIASSAPADGQRHAWLNLIVRVRDGFSKDLSEYAQSHSSVRVRFDGPYGSSHAWDVLDRSDISIVVAGGSGIAVAYPLIWRLIQGDMHRDEEQQERRRRVCLVWVVHDASHISWIGQERLDELREMGLDFVQPAPTSKGGRPDLDAILQDRVQAAMDFHKDRKVGVVVSGPDSMNRNVRNKCARMAWDGYDVDIAVEKFGW